MYASARTSGLGRILPLAGALVACAGISWATVGSGIANPQTASARASRTCSKAQAKSNRGRNSLVKKRRTRCTPGGSVLRSDPATDPNPLPLWNSIDAQNSSRASWYGSGGPNNRPFRRLTVVGGDDDWGERAELGYNSRMNGLGAPWGTFYLYFAGQRRVTSYDMRLPTDFPINTNSWQVVTQMKQTGPSANSGGTPVLALEARQGRWVLTQSDSPGASSDTHELWSTPATLGSWTHISWNVTYSPNPSQGKVQLTVGGVQSPTFTSYTQKYEVSPGSQGLRPGDPIPSHLRMGLYHDSSVPGSHVDFTNVQVRG
jgi:Polysaccharide lyase